MPRRPPASRNLVAPIQRSLPACGRVGFVGGRALRLEIMCASSPQPRIHARASSGARRAIALPKCCRQGPLARHPDGRRYVLCPSCLAPEPSRYACPSRALPWAKFEPLAVKPVMCLRVATLACGTTVAGCAGKCGFSSSEMLSSSDRIQLRLYRRHPGGSK